MKSLNMHDFWANENLMMPCLANSGCCWLCLAQHAARSHRISLQNSTGIFLGEARLFRCSYLILSTKVSPHRVLACWSLTTPLPEQLPFFLVGFWSHLVSGRTYVQFSYVQPELHKAKTNSQLALTEWRRDKLQRSKLNPIFLNYGEIKSVMHFESQEYSHDVLGARKWNTPCLANPPTPACRLRLQSKLSFGSHQQDEIRE